MSTKGFNQVLLIGNLGRDAETKFTAGGKAVTNFSIGITERYKKGEEWVDSTEWVNCTMWQGENLAQYLVKGQQVHVLGSLKTQTYENKDNVKVYKTYVNVQPSDVTLLGGGKGANGNGTAAGGAKPASNGAAPRTTRPATNTRAAAATATAPDDFAGNGTVTDDDVPF